MSDDSDDVGPLPGDQAISESALPRGSAVTFLNNTTEAAAVLALVIANRGIIQFDDTQLAGIAGKALVIRYLSEIEMQATGKGPNSMVAHIATAEDAGKYFSVPAKEKLN